MFRRLFLDLFDFRLPHPFPNPRAARLSHEGNTQPVIIMHDECGVSLPPRACLVHAPTAVHGFCYDVHRRCGVHRRWGARSCRGVGRHRGVHRRFTFRCLSVADLHLHANPSCPQLFPGIPRRRRRRRSINISIVAASVVNASLFSAALTTQSARHGGVMLCASEPTHPAS